MDNEAKQPAPSSSDWTATQTYAMAALCLFIGLLVGYLGAVQLSPQAEQRRPPGQCHRLRPPHPPPRTATHAVTG